MGSVIAAFLVALFVALNVVAPMVSGKILAFGAVTFPAGTLLIAMAYGTLDILNDWKGRKAARETVVVMLALRIVFMLLVALLVAAPAKFTPPGYDELFTQSARLSIAGLASLFVGAYLVNTPLFSELRDRMKGRHFTLRYLVVSLPTIVAGAVTHSIIGFYGTQVDVWAIIWGSIVARVVIGILIAPGVWIARVGVRRYGERPG